jgi:ribonuclease HII
MLAPPRTVVHRAAGLWALERALQRRGFERVAGADEAGRGACAGPLVVGRRHPAARSPR